MTEVRIRTKLESDTPHLPELRELIGREVEIVVTDQSANLAGTPNCLTPKSFEQLAWEQGVHTPATFNSLLGKLPDDLFEGFDEHLEQLRKLPNRPRDL